MKISNKQYFEMTDDTVQKCDTKTKCTKTKHAKIKHTLSLITLMLLISCDVIAIVAAYQNHIIELSKLVFLH